MDEDIIINQNPWWKNKHEIEKDEKVEEALKKRHKLLFKFKDRKNILWIGPRQVGKTTFFKLLIYDLLINKNVDPKEIAYYSCELIKDYREFPKLINKFSILAKPKYIFLDEISFVKDWHKGIKYLLDSNLLKNKILYLTGSSSLELKKERFPGRDITIREFLPMTYSQFIEIFTDNRTKIRKKIKFESNKEVFEKCKEILYLKEDLDKMLYNYIQTGGFPRAFYELMEEDKIRKETYEIYWNWIINDIAKIERSEKITIGIFEGIIKNYGTKFSLNSIAKEIEIGSHITVREYLEILENLFLIRNFYTFDTNKQRVVFRKMRKAYFIDPFILHAVNFKLKGTPFKDYAKIVEGVISEAIIRRFNQLKVGFYHNKKEIDICFKDFCIEVKWQEKVDEKDFPKVNNIKNKILISKNDFEFIKEKKLLIIPASIFLSLI